MRIVPTEALREGGGACVTSSPATLPLLMFAAVLILVSGAGCLAPARTATAVDPVRVLRAE